MYKQHQFLKPLTIVAAEHRFVLIVGKRWPQRMNFVLIAVLSCTQPLISHRHQ